MSPRITGKTAHWRISRAKSVEIKRLMDKMDHFLQNKQEEEYRQVYDKLRSMGMPEVGPGDHLKIELYEHPSILVVPKQGKPN